MAQRPQRGGTNGGSYGTSEPYDLKDGFGLNGCLLRSHVSQIGTKVYYLVPVPPFPLAVQNLENKKRSNLVLTRRLCARSLNFKDLHAKPTSSQVAHPLRVSIGYPTEVLGLG